MSTVVVYGMEVDPDHASNVKKVLTLSIIGALLVLIGVLINFTAADGGTGGLLGLVSLAIPACGFFGVKQKNAQLLNCFMWWNCVAAVFNIIGTLILILGISACELANSVSNNNNWGSSWGTTVTVDCSIVYVVAVFYLLTTVVQCASFILTKPVVDAWTATVVIVQQGAPVAAPVATA